ncbi:hypothetical protein [Austwickia chelonae]|uniref:hypothetical protein n=1 Tax=Austwickia chelonae TaxID=100225 RepID=UPI0013C354FA|nr:hypothetical protein [Austwickia chelonae]
MIKLMTKLAFPDAPLGVPGDGSGVSLAVAAPADAFVVARSGDRLLTPTSLSSVSGPPAWGAMI